MSESGFEVISHDDLIEESTAILRSLNFDDLPGQMTQQRDDEVMNNAGGFVYQISDVNRIRRFLILGTSGGTYYVSEKKLTLDNIEDLIAIVKKGSGGLILRELVAISLAGRAPKQEPTLLALALCTRAKLFDKPESSQVYKNYLLELQTAAYQAVPKVCRIPTFLFTFVGFCEMISKEYKRSSGWSRAMRNAVSNWYLETPSLTLAMHVTKYPQRNGWSHRDLLRLAHVQVKSKNEEALVYDQILHFATEGKLELALTDPDYSAPPTKKARKYKVSTANAELPAYVEVVSFLKAVTEMKSLAPEAEVQASQLITENGLVREHVPTNLLNSKVVWEALLAKMPLTALIRNLGKLSAVGLLTKENPAAVQQVVRRLSDEQALHKARVHPMAVLIANKTYSAGKGIKGSNTWPVSEPVVSALDSAFLDAFHNVQPTGKRFLLGLDVSGSMHCPCAGSEALSCAMGTAAMAAVALNTEDNVKCIAFSDHIKKLPFDKTWDVEKMMDTCDSINFGSTDCAAPMLYAIENKLDIDVFIIYTDCETWFGEVHPDEALRKYRKEMNIPDAKLIVVGMAATEFSIADPKDPGMLDVVGFDSAVPEIISSFVLGKV